MVSSNEKKISVSVDTSHTLARFSSPKSTGVESPGVESLPSRRFSVESEEVVTQALEVSTMCGKKLPCLFTTRPAKIAPSM